MRRAAAWRRKSVVAPRKVPNPARLKAIGDLPFRKSTVESELEFQFPEMELVFLGTAAGSPSPFRSTTAIALKLPSQNWLFDAGEGTSLQFGKSALKLGLLNRIFVTHLHGDHIFGLPGLICSYDTFVSEESNSNNRSTQRLSLYGPPGLYNYLTSALTNARLGNSEISVTEFVLPSASSSSRRRRATLSRDLQHPSVHLTQVELVGDSSCWTVYEDEKYTVKASTVEHSVTTFGYVIQEKDFPGRFNVEKATQLGLPPGPQYKRLTKGLSVDLPDGSVIHPSDVIGLPTPGRKVVILGDTCNAFDMVDLATGADLVVHEATLSMEKRRRMLSRGHSTPAVAGLFARRAEATLLAMTHFSVTMRPWEVAKAQQIARQYFGKRAVYCAEDFLRIPIRRETNSKKNYGS